MAVAARRTWKVCFIPVGDEVVPDVGGIGNISQEVGVLLHSRNAKCGALDMAIQDCMKPLSFLTLTRRGAAVHTVIE